MGKLRLLAALVVLGGATTLMAAEADCDLECKQNKVSYCNGNGDLCTYSSCHDYGEWIQCHYVCVPSSTCEPS